MSSERLQPQWLGSSPTRPSPPRTPISGSSGLKAPIEKQLQRLMKQSIAVLLKARTARSSPTGKTAACPRSGASRSAANASRGTRARRVEQAEVREDLAHHD